jgi:hypothetical protein
MSQKSNYLENAILDHLTGTTPLASPTPFLALSTTEVGEAGDLSGEVSGNGYVREEITFTTASGGETSNNEIVFTEATGGWGTITHFAICDAETGGNVLYHGQFSQGLDVVSGDSYTIKAGNLTIQEK